MTTLLDVLDLIGRATWEPLWIPLLAWTVFALPLWLLLARTDRLHPRAEYRLTQLLLLLLPLGIGATALAELLPGSMAVTTARSLSVTVLPAIEGTARVDPAGVSWQWTQVVGLLTIGAAVVSVLRLVRLALDARAVLRVRSSLACPAPASVQARAARIAERVGTSRPVQICLTPEAIVPITLAGWQPTIVLPTDLADRPEALHLALAHECIHVRRYDDLAHLLERVVEALFAVHPLVNRLQRHVVDARERACDAAVLANDAHSPSNYARLLLSFADGHPLQGLDALALSESPSFLPKRVRAMHASVSRWLSSPLRLTVSLLLVAGLGLFGVVACSDSVAPVTSPSDDASASATPKRAEDVQTPPSLEGGLQALQEELQYPKMAKEAGIQGKVLVQFVVDESGTARDIEVKRSVHRMLDSAAVRAVRSVAFEPGRKKGSPVPVKMTLPVNFALPDQKASDAGKRSGSVEGKTVNESPQIRGGMEALREQLTYPDLVRKAGIDGTVHLTFTVTETGDVNDARVTKSVHEALDAAALKAVESVSFRPAKKSGQATAREMTLPVTFALLDA